MSGMLGGTKILDGNIHPLFDHQTVLEDSDGGKIQSVKNSITGIDDIVAVAETGHGEDKGIVEKGSITFSFDIPEMKICYAPNEYIATVTAVAIGGYHPSLLETQTVTLDQDKEGIVHEAYIEWGLGQYEPCWTWTYVGEIKAKDFISLDSTQYPDVYGPTCWTNWATDPVTGYICGKKVDFDIETDWCGCDDYNTQGFTILPLRDSYQFPQQI
ncbi:MAG: hypothetical protein ACFFBQ_18785 [Promethearchaeota archaeon]